MALRGQAFRLEAVSMRSSILELLDLLRDGGSIKREEANSLACASGLDGCYDLNRDHSISTINNGVNSIRLPLRVSGILHV